MATEAAGSSHVLGPVTRFFQSLAPALIISMGFIDLGKWVVAVEGGAQFGFNPVLLVLLFNCSAIFCQYLATCIGAVSGKNLAQICCEEYDKSACLLLGILAEVSRMVSDISTIIGMAHGFNLLFGVELLACTILAAIVASALPIAVKVLGKHTSEVQFAGISGFVLLFYVIGILSAQPEVPVVLTGTFPMLSRENSYLVMALLGSNVIVHNFYSQSSMVQQQRRCFNAPVDHLLHDHFFAILFTFSGTFLVNCVLMNLATSLFENAGLTFQDVFLQMDQMFTFHIAPVAFFTVLLLSSLISVFTWVLGGHVVINDLFGIHVSFWIHLACSKVVVVVPAIYYARLTGAEGLYQLLIFCQVALALLLPSSVIPLFRVASSKQWMGNYIMSWYLEILALFTFIWMLLSNLVFITEVFLGNGNWIVSIRSSMMLLFVFLLFVACMSLGLTLYLMVTPLKSASKESKWVLQSKDQLLTHGHADNSSAINFREVHETEAKPVAFGHEELPVLELDYNAESPEVISESLKEHQTAADFNSEAASAFSASDIVIEESKFSVDLYAVEPADKLLNSSIPDLGICEQIESNEPRNEQKNGMESVGVTHKGEETAWEQADVPAVILPPIAIEGSEQLKSYTCKSNDSSSGAGSLSRLSGLGRAVRRQFAATLDEFWGHLFDFHGELTQEARTNKVDILLGLHVKNAPAKIDIGGSEALRNHLTDKERGSGMQVKPRDYSFSNPINVPNKESFYGYQTGSPSWFSGPQADMYGQIPSSDPTDIGERRYSSLHLPQQFESRDYQPATIHGYQISSYFRGMGVGRFDPSGFSLNQPLFPKSPDSFIANYGDRFKFGVEQDGFNSLGTTGFDGRRSSGTGREAELASYDSSFSGIYEGAINSEKRYRSLPDISGHTLSSRNSFSNKNFGHSARTGPRPVGRTTFGQSQFTSPNYRSGGAPLTFDELSPSTNYKDIFLSQSNTGADKSLWSRQPYEQLFGLSVNPQLPVDGTADILGLTQDTFSYAELENKLLVAFKDCIVKILKLDGSDWLFRQNAGADEELIDQLVSKEIFLRETGTNETSTTYLNEHQDLSSEREFNSVDRIDLDFCGNETVVKCGENCIWRAGIIVSFGVWCIRRILELSLVESRPELWGKYTYVLNRLQGIIEPAFSRPRSPIISCPCIEIPVAYMQYDRRNQNNLLHRASIAGGSWCTTSAAVLDLVKDVEVAISGRKGRSGTAAGDVAFPKGKENLASVLKRYRRRLSSKSSVTGSGGSSSRKFPLPAASVL